MPRTLETRKAALKDIEEAQGRKGERRRSSPGSSEAFGINKKTEKGEQRKMKTTNFILGECQTLANTRAAQGSLEFPHHRQVKL